MIAFGPAQPVQSSVARRILFCRVLALAAQAGKKIAAHLPLVVSEGKVVRDACLFSLGRGIYVGQGAGGLVWQSISLFRISGGGPGG